MKILSLFDGMSVAQQALKDAGKKVDKYYASEIDAYAIAVTQSNFPDTIQMGDVSRLVSEEGFSIGISGKGFLENANDIDLLIGGSPCQDLSIAKKGREGLSGSRSSLFWQYVYMRNYVKPKYFILENVASMPKEARDTISKALGVQPVMINASLVSAQNRKRLFWIGERVDIYDFNEEYNYTEYHQVEIPYPEDRGILLKDILENEVDEKYYIKTERKNTLVSNRPQDADKPKGNTLLVGGTNPTIRIGSLNSGGQGDRIYSQDGKSVSLSANGGCRGAKTGLCCVGIIPESIKPKGNYLPRERVYSDEGKFRAISTVSNQQPSVLQDTQIRKLTPTECLRLQSMPDDYFDKAEYKGKPISNTQRYKMCGNAFNKEVIVHIINNLI